MVFHVGGGSNTFGDYDLIAIYVARWGSWSGGS